MGRPLYLHVHYHVWPVTISSVSQGKKDKTKSSQKLPEDERDHERQAAWIAIRCAAAAGQAQRAYSMLVGDPAVTSQSLSTKAREVLPDFLCLDLMGPYVLGEKKREYKSKCDMQ